MLLLRISLVFLFSFLFADVKIYAPFVKEVNKTIFIKNPYLIYKDFFIQAKKAIIKNNKEAIFEGNVTIFYKNDVIEANEVEIISKDNIVIKNSFIYDYQNDFWFKNRISKIKNKNLIYFKNTIFSSCCVKNPDWYLFVKRGSYNKKTKYIKFYHLILYIHNVPVFYFPFYFNSFDKTRRSGLLRPYVGFSAKEGFLYSQPIYFVWSIRSDLEITPTIRTKRGKGVYATFRFVDSPYSFGKIRVGEFFDFDKYYLKNNLAHKKHFGYEIEYKRDKVFDDDKLYINIKYANDVDYFYLNPYNYTFNTSYLTDKIITSKIDYLKFFRNSVLGIYNRYYIDTSLLSNKDTIQTIPQINYHIFENKYKKLLFSLDYNFYNYFNENHKKYFVHSFYLPFGISFPVINNYVYFKLSEIFNASYGNYYNSDLQPSYIIDGYTQFKFYSSLLNSNHSSIHVVVPSVSYNLRNFSKKKLTSDILNNTSLKNNISLNLFQLFQKNDLYIEHNFHQILYINSKKKEKMENRLSVMYSNFEVEENNKFDWFLKRTVYNAFSFKFNNEEYFLSISHYYQYSPISKSVDIKLSKSLKNYKNFYFEYNYDLINKYTKFMLVGVKLNKKCWQYDLSIKKSINPILKENGISYVKNYLFNINVNFYPIGGLKQSILFK